MNIQPELGKLVVTWTVPLSLNSPAASKRLLACVMQGTDRANKILPGRVFDKKR
jgi:hypothetical protein